jgi:hypothetical protein
MPQISDAKAIRVACLSMSTWQSLQFTERLSQIKQAISLLEQHIGAQKQEVLRPVSQIALVNIVAQDAPGLFASSSPGERVRYARILMRLLQQPSAPLRLRYNIGLGLTGFAFTLSDYPDSQGVSRTERASAIVLYYSARQPDEAATFSLLQFGLLGLLSNPQEISLNDEDVTGLSAIYSRLRQGAPSDTTPVCSMRGDFNPMKHHTRSIESNYPRFKRSISAAVENDPATRR